MSRRGSAPDADDHLMWPRERSEPRVIGEFDPNAALQNNRLYVVLIDDCRRTGARNQDPGEAIRVREAATEEVDAMIEAGKVRDAYAIVAWDCFRRHAPSG